MEIRKITLENPNQLAFNVTYYESDSIYEKPTPEAKPLALIFAGGGFMMLSKREQEPVALKYLSEGFQVALVEYNLLQAGVSLFPNAALSGLTAVAYFRQHAKELAIDPEKIVTIGFSAGGTVVGMMNSLLNDAPVLQEYGLALEEVRPNVSILGYPLLDVYSLTDAFPKEAAAVMPTEEKYLQASLGVGNQTPPTFIFHTANDPLVPVRNALDYSQALSQKDIPFELHIFSQGVHGLATARKISATKRSGEINPEVAEWMSLSLNWLKLMGIQ